MQVFSSRQVDRCFAVPAARRIYATADQLAVAEIEPVASYRSVRWRYDWDKPKERISVYRDPVCTYIQRSDVQKIPSVDQGKHGD